MSQYQHMVLLPYLTKSPTHLINQLRFSLIQHIVRTYDCHQSSMWSAGKGNQYTTHTKKYTTPSPIFIHH